MGVAIPYQSLWGNERIIDLVNHATFIGQIEHCEGAHYSSQGRVVHASVS